MSQDYLDFYYTSSTIPLLGSGLGPQCKNGPRPQILGPHKNKIGVFFLYKKRVSFPVFSLEPNATESVPKKLEKADMEGENASATEVERIFTKKGKRRDHQIV